MFSLDVNLLRVWLLGVIRLCAYAWAARFPVPGDSMEAFAVLTLCVLSALKQT